MGISKAYAPIALLLIAMLAHAAGIRDWKYGRLVSVEAITSADKDERRYECVVSDKTFSYTIEYQHPIKALAHLPIKFAIEWNTLVLLDADGKERRAHIEKRDRVLFDSPERFLHSK
jgi:hypothetical protein